ncbi:MAG TPA: Gfo/Idh/MocA family oxidoreductase [Pirellulaceae bacterium]|nr:Gfo/Idh/MocA family oxidoreductase [Pirellulaceae bacterium]HMO92446.1 Gfo/Idh/MocA family oxidoreductase [Pirellulaceae bacterium]HMP67884.1 Gfo/Idh/MocA family oxidoreductase [Pirellulaceae bacterium]
MDLTNEQEQIGRDNYYSAVTAYENLHRRDFLKRTVAGGATIAAGVGAMYFGYHLPPRPIRVGIIGTGDEGNVLIGALNPAYVEVKSICDIRPSSIHRAFHGDWSTPNTLAVRPGLLSVYGWKDEEEARRHVKVHEDYREMLADDSIEGVIIAVPLHLHAKMTLDAMRAGKHVLVEKLMAHNIAQCKLMARASIEMRRFLSVGHQRHYSLLYDNAVNLLRWGILGEVHHIRAQWHRGNLPGSDSWAPPLPGGEFSSAANRKIDRIQSQLNSFRSRLANASPAQVEELQKKVAQWTAWDQDKQVAAANYGYVDDDNIRGDGRTRSALEELVRWRLWNRTGGGLMAELGSHQLDASSIFISALSREVGHHVHPLTVHAVGGRHIFPPDRDSADHVYCMFEFPGQGYDYDFPVGYSDEINNFPHPQSGIASFEQDSNKRIVVTYSSINGNGFGGYGEVVMGSRGTLLLKNETEVMLYAAGSANMSVGVRGAADSAILDTAASGDPAPARAAESSGGPVSRGYREEIEHWAWCISTGDWTNQPRCNGTVALGDAVIALTANLAIRRSQSELHGGYIQFRPDWFDVSSDAVPEAELNPVNGPTIASERASLG